MRITLLLTTAVAILLCLTIPVTAAETVLHTETGRPYAASLRLSATPLKSMSEIPFSLQLEDAEIVIHSAICTLTMPDMTMPENRPALECTANRCSGYAIFTMAGAWRMSCDLRLQDGSQATTIFDIEQVTLK